MAMRSQPVEFIDDDDFGSLPVIRRIVLSISRKFQPAHICGVFGCCGSGRTSVLNMCKDFIEKSPLSVDQQLTIWLPPFDSWKMTGMGNLTQALLWHIHRNLPDIAAKDEKVLYKLGKISLTLSTLSKQNIVPGNKPISHSYSTKNVELINNSLPPERKSRVSSQFSACEQINELTGLFTSLGKQLVELCGCNILVIPIDDLDRCTPHEAMQLLFAVRMMTSSEMSFVITADDNILSKFYNYAYGSIFTEKQAYNGVLSFFNDWVHLPSPSLHTVLKKVDFPVSFRDQFFEHLEITGFETIFPATASIRQGCRRFELYMYNEAANKTKTITDHCAWLGWFLINESDPHLIQKIVDSHKPEQILNSHISKKSQEKSHRSHPVEKSGSHSKIVLRQKKSEPDTPVGTPGVIDENDALLGRFVLNMLQSMDTTTLVNRLRDVYPFL